MIQIWKITDGGDMLISVQDTMENAQYFCEKNNIKNVDFVKVLD